MVERNARYYSCWFGGPNFIASLTVRRMKMVTGSCLFGYMKWRTPRRVCFVRQPFPSPLWLMISAQTSHRYFLHLQKSGIFFHCKLNARRWQSNKHTRHMLKANWSCLEVLCSLFGMKWRTWRCFTLVKRTVSQVRRGWQFLSQQICRVSCLSNSSYQPRTIINGGCIIPIM